ncbi:hypothetical protein NKH18_22615 [Streptomyces sp. M10(2022)]
MKIVVERQYAPGAVDYERLVSLVESTGERVVLIEAKVPVSVLFPAGWWPSGSTGPAPPTRTGTDTAGRGRGRGRRERDEVGRRPTAGRAVGPPAGVRPLHPVRARRWHARELRPGGMVVAVQLTADEAAWLEEKAMHARQGYMSPEQAAAFQEFLDRQPAVGEQ